MQRLFLILLCGLIFAACTSTNDPGGTTPPASNTVAVTHLTDLPMAGGDVTGIAITPGNAIITVVDGKLYTMSAAGGTMQLINGDVVHSSMAVAPSGEVYTLTATDFRTYDLTSGAHRDVPIDPAGPFALGRRIEESEITFSPSGEPYVKIINNTPQTYIYHSTDKGGSWQSLPLPRGFQYGGGLAFAPNGDILVDCAFGLYRSSDHGASWTTYPPPLANYGGNMLVTSNGDIYYYVRGGGGLKVSHNGGTSFTDLAAFNRAPYFTSVQQGPDGALYALASGGAGAAGSTSFLRSTDGGMTWGHVLYAQGRVFAMRGSLAAIGLESTGFSTEKEHGGIVISRNGGSIWVPTGTVPVKQISDVGFDRDGNLMILADEGLFRRTSEGWQTLGTQPGIFSRFASTPQGGLLLANTTSVFYSSDNGLSWSESLVPDYQPSTTGSAGIPALVGRKNGEFLFSITNYADAYGYTNGQLYRVTANGTLSKLQSVSQSFYKIVEDHNGTLYGGTQVLDQLSYTFTGRAYQSSDGGGTWVEGKSFPSGLAFNSQNRYFTFATAPHFALGTPGSDQKTELTLDGFTSLPQYITRALFGADDRLYLITLDAGLFTSNGPVR